MAAVCCFGWNFADQSKKRRHPRRPVPKNLPVLVLLLLLSVPLTARGTGEMPDTPVLAAEPIVHQIKVVVEQGFGREPYWEAMVRRVIYLKKGDRFSASRLNASLQALELCGNFRDITVDAAEDGRFMRLFFQVTPFRRIREIQVEGKYPLFEQDVLNAMTRYPGDPFVEKDLPQQTAMVESLYRRQGYVAPQVHISAAENPSDGSYNLLVRIDKGPAYRLNRIVFTGNRSIPEDVLVWQMKTWRKFYFGGALARFVEQQLTADVDGLIQFYRARRYADVDIRHKIERLPEQGLVNVFIDVDEGPLYQIFFDGNQLLSDAALKKELVLFKTGNAGNIGLRKSLEKIRGRYRKAGFLKAAVDLADETVRKNGSAFRNLRFRVTEGPRTRVRQVAIYGNTAFDSARIKKQVLTRPAGLIHDGAFHPALLKEDLASIRSLYENNGFGNAEISSSEIFSGDSRTVAIGIHITEGPQTIVSTVDFTGLSVPGILLPAKKLKLKPGRPFSPKALENDKTRIAILISEKGYPYVQVAADTFFSPDSSSVAVTYRIDPGQAVVMGNVFYSGNFRTRNRRLDQELKMKPGEPFSLNKMFRSQQRIRGMNIFRSVDFRTIGLKEKADTIHLFAHVEEKKPYFFEAGGGYESDRGFYGSSKVGDHNFLGLNKDVWLGGDISEIGYRVASGVFEPSLFASRIATDLTLYTQKEKAFNQTFGTRTNGANLTFSRRWYRHVISSLGVQYETREIVEASSDFKAANETAPRGIAVVTPSLQYDSRNNFMRPRKGVFSSAAVDVSNSIDSNVDDFLRYRLDLRLYHTPVDRLTLAWMARVGHIDPYGANHTIAEDQLFYLGGTASVRGFDENRFMVDTQDDPVGGRSSIIGSLEARIDLGARFETALFYDIGRLSQADTPEDTADVRASAGVGLRYITPVGAVGLVYGFKLDRRSGEPPGRFHFSIGYTF